MTRQYSHKYKIIGTHGKDTLLQITHASEKVCPHTKIEMYLDFSYKTAKYI